ncbi:calcium-translocating P-type ATPase, PMCA-type [Candidatus Microgenomates bacterium]|nr:calcium-translocating P-type ATPase, PMCA-type [Candidatus Microgenomates bacterium]
MYYTKNKVENSYSQSVEEIIQKLQTDPQKGLTSAGAENRLQKYGPNVLKKEKGKSALFIFFSQFKSFLIVILITASLVSFALGETLDAALILAIVVLNGIVGFIQEFRVEKTIKQLKKLVTVTANVMRDGSLQQISSAQLVPGDLIILEEGQKIPADIRIIQSFNLETNEASLTGESTPVTKDSNTLAEDVILAERKNMLFSGTNIAAGKGIGIVTSTGMDTEIGKIAQLVSQEIEPPTPLQAKLNNLGKFTGKIILVIATIIGIEQLLFGQNLLNALISAIALAVAAIPEGLPAVVTISLALGTRRLLKQKSLIRHLAAAETLGSTDVICVDKTGTLTEGAMKVTEIYGDNREKILTYGLLASNARVNGDQIIGDSTEAALIQATIDSGLNQDTLLKTYQRISEIPFSSDRKMMSVIVKTKEGQLLISKGATEVILGKCSDLSAEQKEEILKLNDDMAKQALRVLAIAYKPIPLSVIASEAKQSSQIVEDRHVANAPRDDGGESDLIFLGLVGMIDPPRKGVKEAIETCQKEAGIKVVMITGDHLLTAQAIASQIGIEGKSITGQDLDKLSDEEFEKEVEQITVYARVNPEHKIKIIKALKAHGHQVAMTGDGVNDAPALKAADIGVAMGITGTDVAKEASDIILLDDHFSTIVEAIKEGRAIFDNIRKFVNYLLSSNIMEVLVISLAVIIGGGHLPLLPIHLLWINLVTDGLPAIALGVDPPRKNIMNLKPQHFREEIAGGRFLGPLMVVSVLLTVAILAIFFIYQKDPIYEQTMVFSAIVFYEMLRIIAIRSEYKLPFFSNPFLVLAIAGSLILQLLILYLPISFAGITLQELFKVHPLNLRDWVLLLGVGVFLLFVMRILVITPVFNFFRK